MINEKKLDQLFSAARAETPPTPETGFENLVLSAIRREPRGASAPNSVLDQLGALFPRLAWVVALVVALSLAADFGLSALGVPDLTDGVAQISDQWLFTSNGL